MKIYFCDGCNESLPLADVQAGQVTTIKGKLFCQNCVPPGMLAAPAEAGSAPARRRGAPWMALAVVLLLGWTAWRDRDLILDAGPSEQLPGDTGAPDDLQRRLEGLEAGLNQASADGAQRGRDLTMLRADMETLRAADAEHTRGLERRAEEIEQLGRVQVSSGRVVEKVELALNRVDSLEFRMDALSDTVAAHQAALSVGAVPTSTVTELGPDEPELDPEVAAHLAEVRRLLEDPDPGLRFEGLERVTEESLDGLTEDVAALLADTDLFVRLEAMNVLAILGAEEAVPALFEVLSDNSAVVRKKAAETLVRLTGYDPGYDPRAAAAERSRSVERWRAWYDGRGTPGA